MIILIIQSDHVLMLSLAWHTCSQFQTDKTIEFTMFPQLTWASISAWVSRMSQLPIAPDKDKFIIHFSRIRNGEWKSNNIMRDVQCSVSYPNPFRNPERTSILMSLSNCILTIIFSIGWREKKSCSWAWLKLSKWVEKKSEQQSRLPCSQIRGTFSQTIVRSEKMISSHSYLHSHTY